MSFYSTDCKCATQIIGAMFLRPRVTRQDSGQPRRLIRQAERNMLREMYNFNKHAARVYFLSIQIVLCSKSED